jgi:hypothetical protein
MFKFLTTFFLTTVIRAKERGRSVPYFIQIICKNCGYYASENKRRFIGYPELEKVVRILIGQEVSSQRSLIKKLTENTFQNNHKTKRCQNYKPTVWSKKSPRALLPKTISIA